MVSQLRVLVRRHIAGEINRSEFRREFVSRFFSEADRNPELSGLYEAVDSAFSALDHGYLDENAFRNHLAQLAQVVYGTNVVLSIQSVASTPVNVARLVSFSANDVSSLSALAPANVALLGEFVEAGN